jgi:phosphatidate phosphatase APP1
MATGSGSVMKRGLVWLARGVARLLQLLMLPLGRRSRQRPATVLAYRGYGNRHELRITGRVVEDTRGPSTHVAESLWADIKRIYRALASRPVPGAEVRLCHGASEQSVQADENGFFTARLVCAPPAEDPAARQGAPASAPESADDPAPTPGDDPEDDPVWEQVEVELVRPAFDEPVRKRACVLVPTERARMVVISDIDDTVMVTGVAHKLLMLWRLFARPGASRVPFPGVAAFYRALHAGSTGDQQNPMLYVSRAPWTIYPELDRFFELHQIPIGPVLHLRDWGISFHHPLPRRQQSHKLDAIEQMLELYLDLPFIMLGDSGQHDPEVYSEVARNHPRRIQAVYIRDVTGTARRTEEIQTLAHELRKAGADLVLTDSTLAMAHHAATSGWIAPTAIDDIEREVSREGAPPHAAAAAS